MSRHVQKHVRETVRMLEHEFGIKVRVSATGRSHTRLSWRLGENEHHIVTSCSPSCGNGLFEVRATVRRLLRGA